VVGVHRDENRRQPAASVKSLDEGGENLEGDGHSRKNMSDVLAELDP
jgi:hypothetical protein